MSANLPEPLTPADCDLQDFEFMPVMVRRLLKSETWALGTGDERAASVALWFESWHQVPAASLPSDSRLLQRLADSQKWAKVKDQALRGWVACRDGRLYHPVVAEKALEAWIEKLINSISGAAGNAKRWNIAIDTATDVQRLRTAVDMLRALEPKSKALRKKSVLSILGGSPPDVQPPSPPDTPRASPPDRKGQGEGQGQGQRNTDSVDPADAGQPPASGSLPEKPQSAPARTAKAATKTIAPDPEKPTVTTWKAYADAYRALYQAEPVRNAKVNGQLAQVVARLGGDEAPLVAAFFLTHKNTLYVRAMHPVDLLLRDCEKLRTEWVTGRLASSGAPEDRRGRQLTTAALMTGAAIPPAHQTSEVIDVGSRFVES